MVLMTLASVAYELLKNGLVASFFTPPYSPCALDSALNNFITLSDVSISIPPLFNDGRTANHQFRTFYRIPRFNSLFDGLLIGSISNLYFFVLIGQFIFIHDFHRLGATERYFCTFRNILLGSQVVSKV